MERPGGKQINQFVNNRISYLIKISGQPLFSSLMAKLRRGVGREPGSLPEIWGFIFEDFPEDLAGRGVRPSLGENAVHSALTLFALHQQSKDIKEKCMNKQDQSVAMAVRQLIRLKPDREEAIKRRFLTSVTAESYEELMWHLRGIIQLLRSQDVPLDYPQLAQDLFYYQSPNFRDHVRLKWGRQFYRFD